MRLFSREQTPVEQAEGARDKSATLRDRLVVQVAQAETELAQLQGRAASAALREAPLELEETASAVANAQATAAALNSALGSARSEFASAEQVLATERDREQRAASIHELEDLINAIETAGLTFCNALNDLLLPLERASEISLDAKSVAGLFGQLKHDADQLISTACEALGHQAKQIEAGQGRAALPKPAPAPVATAPAPTTTSIFPLFDVKWTDHTNTIRAVARYWDAPLPIPIAQRAITAGIVVATDSPQAVKFRKERGSPNVGDVDRAVDLDQTNPAPPPAEPDRYMRPFADPIWQIPSSLSPRPWIGGKSSTKT